MNLIKQLHSILLPANIEEKELKLGSDPSIKCTDFEGFIHEKLGLWLMKIIFYTLTFPFIPTTPSLGLLS